MNRRKFLTLGGIGLTAIVAGGIASLWNLMHPEKVTEPANTQAATDAPPQSSPTPFAPEEETATPAEATSAPTQGPGKITPLFDDFTDPHPAGSLHGTLASDMESTRTIAQDSAGQLSTANGALHIAGLAPADHDPLIFSSLVPCGRGQVCGARFKIGSWKNLGNLGLIAADGSPLATLTRAASEAGGGIIDFGAHSYAVLNLYNRCWYDLVCFTQAGQAALAINDGAGLELVMLSDLPELTGSNPASGYLGYSATNASDQEANIDFWYKTGQAYFPGELASVEQPPANFEVDLGENAAWIEVKITGGSGPAGLRIRSLDPKNEYRVYLNQAELKVDRVINGDPYLISKRPFDYQPGAKLAARFNELTLTVYYDDTLVGTFCHKIGAGDLVRGTRAGIYSPAEGSVFTDFRALPVRLGGIEMLQDRLLDSRRVLCLGDSLTNGDKAYGYQNQLRKSLGDGWVTIDAGVSGQTTGEMLARLPSHLEHYRPELVIVLGGINDILGHLDAGTIIANLEAIYTAVRKAGAQVAAVTILPFKGAGSWSEGRQKILESVNDWIMNQAQSVDQRIDAYAQLENAGTRALSPSYAESDHLHLNGMGYAALADAIYLGIR